jgi:peptidoglycan/xylan/chitin deacetylase (PgdA/CDA1 family)
MKKLTVLLIMLSFAAAAQQKMVWPKNKKAVIVLTYDDALVSQVVTAIPQLEKAKLTGTFFLTGVINDQTIPQWRAAAKKGFELGNHTIYHPCTPENDNPTSSAKYTVDMMYREIQVMNAMLFAVDGSKTRTFSFPCTDTVAGGVSYVNAIKRNGLVKYARLGGDSTAIITDFKRLNPFLVPSYGLESNTKAASLIAYVKHVQQLGGMGIIMFHGIGGDWIRTSPQAHQQLVDYLKSQKKEIWVATFKDAMDYVMATRPPTKAPSKKTNAIAAR